MTDGVRRPGPAAPPGPAAAPGPAPTSAPRPDAAPAQPQAREWQPSPRDEILFVALNATKGHSSMDEAAALERQGAAVARQGATLATISPSGVLPNLITGAGPEGKPRTFVLSTPDGLAGFARTLQLPEAQTAAIVAALEAAPTGRVELAKLAQRWAVAERGGQAPARLVVSAHSDGEVLWGERAFGGGAAMRLQDLAKLAEAMPKAAAGVEDLMLSACNTGFALQMESYAKMFPALRSAVAYVDAAPGSASGAIPHLERWERATRGDGTPRRSDFQGTRRGENVTIWTRDGGYQAGRAMPPLGALRDALQRSEGAFAAAWSGQDRVRDPHRGPVRERYEVLQRLAWHGELPAEQREAVALQRDRTLRLLYFGGVAAQFAKAHEDPIREGYAALGLEAPDFGALGRAEALRAIGAFRARLQREVPPPEAAATLLPLLDGLAELHPRVIPAAWVTSAEAEGEGP